MRDWIKVCGAATLAACLFAIPAGAAMPGDWDANSDAGVTREEFNTRFTTMGVFGKWDTDKDGKLSQAEWTAGMATGGDAFKNRFAAASDADPFKTWNTDGSDGLTEKEFYDGIYAGYDDNRDNTIQEPEFGDIGTDTGPSGFWGS